MTSFLPAVVRFYALLLRLFPGPFRAEFGAEMQGVFAESLAHAAAQGWQALLLVCWRELRDLPHLLFIQYRHQFFIQKEERLMLANSTLSGDAFSTPEDNGQGTWRQALLAGLPHALLALLIGVTSLLAVRDLLSPVLQRLAPVFTGILAVGLLAVLVIILLKAQREGWPLWSASWYFYVAVPLIMLPLGLLQQWDALAIRVNRLDEAFLYIAVPLLLGFLLYMLICRDRFMALLAVLPLVAVLWTPVLEFVPSPLRSWLTVATWLLVGLTAISSVRLGNAGTAIWLALGMNLLIGLPYAYAQTYLKVLPEDAPVWLSDAPTMLDFINTFAPYFLGTATLILGPALIWWLRRIGRQGGKLGTRGYRLAAVGFTFMVLGNLAAYWWMLRHWPIGEYLIYQVTVYGGLGLYLFGSILLLATRTSRKRLPEATSSAFLVLALIGLPLVLMLPLLLGMRSMPAAMPFAFLHIHDSRLKVYGLGFVWLLLAGWLASRPGQPIALGYMLQETRQQRVLALLAGLTIAWLATDVINATYWIGRHGPVKVMVTYWVGQHDPWVQESVVGIKYALNMIVGWAVLMTLFLVPSVPGHLRRSIGSLRAA